MKRGGVGRWFVVVLSLFLGLCAPLASLRFVGFFVCSLVAIAIVYNLLMRRSLSARRLDPELRGMRFQRMASRLLVGNRLPLPLPRLTVAESPGPLHCEKATREVALPAVGEAELTFALWSDHRGEYRYGPLRLSGSDPFAFFQWEEVTGRSGRAIVYPRIHPVDLIAAAGTAGGSLPSSNPAFEDITRFRSVREYVGGDELKRINWKVSAKTGRLFTTEYERTLSVPVRVVLDLMSDDFPVRRRDQLCERAIEVAAALLFSYAQRGQPVGLVAAAGIAGGEVARAADSPSEESTVIFGEHAGWRHAELILETLARVRPAPGSADYLRLAGGPSQERPNGMRLLVVGPEASAVQVDQLRALGAARVPIEMFVVRPADAPASRELRRVSFPLHPVNEFGEELLER